MRHLIVPLILSALLAQPLAAGGFSDTVFAPATLQGLLATDTLRYGHALRMPEVPKTDTRPLKAAVVLDEVFTLTRSQEARLVLERVTGDATSPITDFAVTSANPVLIYFLESTARNMTEITGGSPFYIRNRLRDALGKPDLGPAAPVTLSGTTTTAHEIILRPFAEDKARDRMGAFAELTLRFVVAPDQPGSILALSADVVAVDGAYHESLTLLTEGK